MLTDLGYLCQKVLGALTTSIGNPEKMLHMKGHTMSERGGERGSKAFISGEILQYVGPLLISPPLFLFLRQS